MSASKPVSLLESLFYVTVRIQATRTDGRVSTGTGFIYTVPTATSTAYFVVTNKHVIASARGLTLHLLKADASGDPILGEVIPITLTDLGPQTVYAHPDPQIDVVVIGIAGTLQHLAEQGTPVFFRSIGSASVPTLSQIDELDAVEEVRFVGYPNGIYDTKNFLPVIRNGTVATYLQHDYEGKPTFLIDASVFPGSSGSPVVIAQSGAWTTKQGNTILGEQRLLLLGIVAAVKQTQRSGRLQVLPTTTVTPIVGEMIDLGIVFKARTIDECVDGALASIGATRTDRSAAEEPTAAERDQE